MSDTKQRVSLRMDFRIFEKLQSEAKKNKRSVTKEIEYQLEKVYFNK